MTQLIEEYLQGVKIHNPKSDITRLRGYITECAGYFLRCGIDSPAVNDYTALREYLSKGGTLGESAIGKRISETKKFYEWKGARIEMTQDKPANMAGAAEKKRGRPKKVYASGEEAKTKYSMYFPLSLYEALNDLAHFKRSTITDILIDLASEYVERNNKKLEIFRKAIAEAENL